MYYSTGGQQVPYAQRVIIVNGHGKVMAKELSALLQKALI